jgi:hypothetical protein
VRLLRGHSLLWSFLESLYEFRDGSYNINGATAMARTVKSKIVDGWNKVFFLYVVEIIDGDAG